MDQIALHTLIRTGPHGTFRTSLHPSKDFRGLLSQKTNIAPDGDESITEFDDPTGISGGIGVDPCEQFLGPHCIDDLFDRAVHRLFVRVSIIAMARIVRFAPWK